MNERLKLLRRTLDLTQQEFAERIGSVQNTITGYEAGRRNPSSAVIYSICREFNVNEEWLRTGNGEMFNERSTDEELAYLVGSAIPTASDYVKNTFIALGKLSKEFSKEDWEVVKKFVDALAGK